jgi:hypothetical protein
VRAAARSAQAAAWRAGGIDTLTRAGGTELQQTERATPRHMPCTTQPLRATRTPRHPGEHACSRCGATAESLRRDQEASWQIRFFIPVLSPGHT